MGNYFDRADCANWLRDDYANLYNLPAEGAALDSDIALTEAEVDSYVGRRYETPITDATAMVSVKGWCRDLFLARAWVRGVGDEIPKKVGEAAATTRKALEMVSKGTITLAGAESITERPTGGADAIVVNGNDPIMERDDLTGF